MSELLQRLQHELAEHRPAGLHRKPTVDLFLGNDREIGREIQSQEKRVGIIPAHVEQLREFLSALGIGLNVFVLQGAGQRAGYSDSDFIRARCEIMTEAELEAHDRAPDVFHALKEPSKYESRLPRPFCRIGAVHGGNFHTASGLPDLLATEEVAIFDGSNIGAPSNYRIPIRGRMSQFAGEIAAEWISNHLQTHDMRGRVVVVGGGRAGLTAALKLSESEFVSEIHLFENKATPKRVQAVRESVSQAPKISVFELESRDDKGRDDPGLLSSIDEGCVAVLFAVAVPGGKAPKVVHFSHLALLPKNSIVVDISIDERGAIFDLSILPDWSASQIIEHLEPKFRATGIVYRAQENMPRSRAKEASEAHGEVILPYIATLLYLAAREGGADGVRNLIARQTVKPKCDDPKNAPAGKLLEALVDDLRNGLAFHTSSDRIVVEDVVPDRVNILSFLLKKGIPFEFTLPHRESLKKDNLALLKETESALELFPKDVREFLQFSFNHGIVGSVISHPKRDGTTTKGAAAALSLPPEQVRNVLKSLIWKHDDGFVATITSGVKRVDEHKLRALTDAREILRAEPSEVMAATGHVPGAVPTIGLFKFKSDGIIKAIYVSEEVVGLGSVYGSAGSVFLGFKFDPKKLVDLGAILADLTPPDSLLRQSAERVRKIWSEIERAIERDDDKEAEKALKRLQRILENPASDARTKRP